MIFCSNCDNEANAKVIHHDNGDLETPLCRTCREAYEWGQASPESTVTLIDGDDELLEDNYTDSAGECYSDADSGL